jgi:hypothetical protein
MQTSVVCAPNATNGCVPRRSGWDQVESMFHFHLDSWNTHVGTHGSSIDYSHFKLALEQLFAQDPRYIRALCRLLLTDFICFDYALPPECSDMGHYTIVEENSNTVESPSLRSENVAYWGQESVNVNYIENILVISITLVGFLMIYSILQLVRRYGYCQCELNLANK